MNRMNIHFAELKAKNEKALILYITAGDPDLETTLDIMNSLAENGTDCIELGMPFSDPMADGPIIQRANDRALKNKITIDKIFDMVKSFRVEHQTPIVLMGYFNPLLKYGLDNFVQNYKAAGGDGLIIADLPFEEGEELEAICKENDINLIYLLAPELGTDRTKNILKSTSGFVYCVSHYGTTGVGAGPSDNIGKVVESLKQDTNLPIAVGFGISSVEKASQSAKVSDGIIIGSWLIKELEESENKAETAGNLAKSVKKAI